MLTQLANNCPSIDKEYAYYKQLFGDPLKIGEEFAERYREWAWGAGRNNFPKELFGENVPSDAYVKYAIATYLRLITPKAADKSANEALAGELNALRNIRPHAIVTTNYDQFLEVVFPEYQPIVGKQIIKAATFAVGEIFKIHGCASDPLSLVFTDSDYKHFTSRKKYLSAKLLTFFREHPLLFIGYSANDPNIRAILSDIDEALAVPGGIIPNVYVLEWKKERALPDAQPAREKLIAIDGSKSVRIKSIETGEFTWVFEAFGAHQSISGVSPKVLRALLSRSYELVRRDIPRKVVEANFEMLEHAVESQSEFAKLFGLTTISNPSQISANYPYTLTQLSRKLGDKGKSWQRAQKAIDKVKSEKGIDLKESDNLYHCRINYGKSNIRKYSEDAAVLQKKSIAGEAHDLSMMKPSSEPSSSLAGASSTSPKTSPARTK